MNRLDKLLQTPLINPVFPLLLFETMRDMDRPEEILEAEDLTASLPRRFGLSDVVGVQIRRFQNEVRQKRPQIVSQVEDLMRLVVRRPDAEAIFWKAGQRVALHYWQQRSPNLRKAVRFMPRPLALLAAQRAGKRMFKQLAGGTSLVLSRWPLEMRLQQSMSVRADPAGTACAFFSGAFGEHLRHYTGREYRVQHPQCQARGAEVCRWTVEITS